MYTPEIITSLKPNEIFVFGSNNLGQHAGGAARIAVEKFGAVNGIPIGLQGNSFGIITTSFNDREISYGDILNQVELLYNFAWLRPDLTFYVTKIGCGIAGWRTEVIAAIFKEFQDREATNIILPIEFSNQ